jgi:hypothetical protein
MNEFFTCLFSTNGMAYGTGVLIFLITLFLVYKRVIGFTLTLLFLLFALGAALAVANQNSIKNYFDSLSRKDRKASEVSTAPNVPPTEDQTTFAEKMQRAYDDLKAEFEIYKKKVEDFIEQHSEKQNPPEK